MIVVCVLVHDREQNLRRWCEIWNRISPSNAELRIIHNVHRPDSGFDKICESHKIKYYPRQNNGMDIGAFQDVCLRRLPNFEYNFDLILWCPDDILPMSEKFLEPHLHRLPGLGATCYEISQEITTHMRTTGFCVSIDILDKIKFPAPEISTKQHCYDIEYGAFNLWRQITGLGLAVIQPEKIEYASLWDSGYNGQERATRKNRLSEFNKKWGYTSKSIICVVVYNRINNIKHWMECWHECDTTDSELVIVHTGDDLICKQICDENGIKYIKRINRGYDIGVFQDIAKNRLEGFPSYDNLFFFTDDSFPMRRDFIPYWLSKLSFNVGVVCAEVSNIVQPHVRTNAFLISKQTVGKLIFPTDPISTRQDAYKFEHDGEQILYKQLKRLGLIIVCPDMVKTSAIWDSGPESKRPDRSEEHYKIFPMSIKSKVLVISPIHNRHPIILSSLICQTHQEWELYLVHDGENKTDLKSFVDAFHDPRIHYIENKHAKGQFGHPIRQEYLKKLKSGELGTYDYVLITNDDNYYAPHFMEKLLSVFQTNPNALAAYCDMIHSYQKYGVLQCKPVYCHIDCGAVIIRADAAADIGWTNMSHSSDWTYFEGIINKYGIDKWIKVPGVMFVHN